MRRFLRWSLILAFLIFGATVAHAQVLRFERLTQDEGLSQNNIASIEQDSFGFLWVGTQDGLNRFDGYEVRRFRPDESLGSLKKGYVRALAAVGDGRLWVGTREGGLSLWDPAKETFRTWLRDAKGEAKDRENYDAVNALLPNPDGTLWVGTLQGLDLFNPKDESFRHVIARKEIQFLAHGPNGTTWVGIRRGALVSLDGQHKIREHASPSGAVTALVGDAGGRWWAGTASGALLAWNPTTEQFERLEGLANSAPISSLLVDRRGALWLATRGGGVLCHDPRTGKWKTIRTDPSNPHSLPSDRVTKIFEDRSGVLWFGTEVGLASHDPASAAFRVYRASPDALADQYVWAAQSDPEGNIWVGTNGGAARLDRATQTWLTWAADPANPKALLSDSVAAILVDRSGAVWLGGNKGLSRYDPKKDRFESWRSEGDKPALPARVFSLLETRDGSLLVGTGQGLRQWQPATRTFIPLGGEKFGAAVFNMAEDPDGLLWLGTWYNGLYCLDRAAPAVSRGFPFDPEQISVTAVDSRGRLWIGTTHGLYRRDAPGATVRRYFIRDGLPNEMIMGVVEDLQGQIWISTNEGIVRLDPERHTFQGWKAQDGLPSNEFNQMAAGRTPSGEILFGTPSGLLVFDPRGITADATPPQVAFTGFEVFNTQVPIGSAGDRFTLARSILTTADLRLSHREKVVTFTFAGLHFGAPRAARYAYRLEGWDDAWTEADAQRRSATWTNLPPGRYVLRVRAANKDGVWSEPGAAMAIRVLPPPWRTWWAYTSYAMLSVAGISLYLHLRTRELRRRQWELEELVDLRTTELQTANAELAKSQAQLAALMASGPDLLEDQDAWVGRMVEKMLVFEALRGVAAVAFSDTGLRVHGSTLEDLPSLSGLAAIKEPTMRGLDRLYLPARGPSGDILGVVAADGVGLEVPGPLRHLLEGFAHQFGVALDMIRVRTRLHVSEATQNRTLEELHAQGIATLQVCTRCGRCYDHTAEVCLEDGGRLEVPRAMPYRFLGRYRLLRRVGLGGMGAVFSAEDETLARRVAIKLIRPEFVSETSFRLRFEREAKAIARVVHPGVVTLYDSGSTEDGQLYLIMEHLAGLPVGMMLHQYGRANPVQVAQFLRQGARALQAAHEAGVIHRDLKPGNLFLVPQAEHGFQLKILDFGLAQSESFEATLTRTGAVIGTPQYMASEQLLGGQTGPRTDLYAFAAVAYEILTRKPLVSELEVGALMRGTLRVEPQPPSRYVPALPPEADSGFAAALAWEPEDRPSNLLAWADGLASILEGVVVPGGWPEVVPVAEETKPAAKVSPALPPTLDETDPRNDATREI